MEQTLYVCQFAGGPLDGLTANVGQPVGRIAVTIEDASGSPPSNPDGSIPIGIFIRGGSTYVYEAAEITFGGASKSVPGSDAIVIEDAEIRAMRLAQTLPPGVTDNDLFELRDAAMAFFDRSDAERMKSFDVLWERFKAATLAVAS